MNRQKKRILALLVAMVFTVGSQAQMFNIGGEAESSATRSNSQGLFWNGMNDGGNNGGSWNGMNGDGSGFGATWNGMEDATLIGDGLLLFAVSGVCYAAAKKQKVFKRFNNLKFK